MLRKPPIPTALGLILRAWGCIALITIASGAPDPNSNTVLALYHGFVGSGNMGDELCYAIFGHLIRKSLVQMGWTGLVTLEEQSGNAVLKVDWDWKFRLSEYTFKVVGGGSLIEAPHVRWTEEYEAAASAYIPQYVHGTGTMCPLYQWHPSNLLAVTAPILGGGYRGPITAELVLDLAKRNNREPVHLPILGDSGILGSRIFPMLYDHLTKEIDAEKAAKTTRGVVCLSGKMIIAGMNVTSIVKSWMTKYTIVLLSVDWTDRKFYRDVHEEVTRPTPDQPAPPLNRVFVFQNTSSFDSWLAVLHRCDILIVIRLHALILATSAGTPVRVLREHPTGWVSKFVDFQKQTHGDNWDKYYLDPNFGGSVDDLEALIQEVKAEQPTYRASARQAIQATYDKHMGALTEFLGKVLPDRLRSYKDVHIKLHRYWSYGEVELTFS